MADGKKKIIWVFFPGLNRFSKKYIYDWVFNPFAFFLGALGGGRFLALQVFI